MLLGYHSIDDNGLQHVLSHVFLGLSLHQIQPCDGQNLSVLCGHCAAVCWVESQVISTIGPIVWRWAMSLLRCVALMSESSWDTWLAAAVWHGQRGPKRCVRLLWWLSLALSMTTAGLSGKKTGIFYDVEFVVNVALYKLWGQGWILITGPLYQAQLQYGGLYSEPNLYDFYRSIYWLLD